MTDQINTAQRPDREPREPVRVHVRRIEDACIDKDCIEDLRVYLTQSAQAALEGAVNARARSAELLHVYIDVAPIAYNPGHFTADLSFFYRISGEAISGLTRPTPLEGLAVFSKRIALYGGRSQTRVFTSSDNELLPDALYQPRTPDGVVEAVDPMVLSSRVGEAQEGPGSVIPEIPQAVRALFPEEPVLSGGRQLWVSLGQFSTVRLERSTQLLVPALAQPMPDRSCTDDPGTPDEPCDLFARVDFPTQAFYPGNQ